MSRNSRFSNGGSQGSFNGSFRNKFSSFKGRGTPGKSIPESRYIKKASTDVEIAAAPAPTTRFADLEIDQRLKNNIVKKGYDLPTPIQDGAIPHVLLGRDVIGIANTGTGKTAAFLIPLINKIALDDHESALIIVPTRELGQQIQQELRSLTQGLNIYSTLVIGGANIRNQIQELRRNPHFVIGTPGRLKDLIERKIIDMSFFSSFVLDEVDRMVDMGFIRDIKYLISLLPEKRQSLFFSATLSGEINNIIQAFLKDPVTVSVKVRDTADNVDQDIVRVPSGAFKITILEDLLKKDELKKVLIFGRTKRGVEKLSISLFQKGFKVASIHGDKPQAKRQQAIRFFKEDVVTILVATDVAARGIDIPNITHVINYDEPATYEDYVHRIGRTGRANKKGQSLTFVQ